MYKILFLVDAFEFGFGWLVGFTEMLKTDIFLKKVLIIPIILKKGITRLALHQTVFKIIHLNKKRNLISYADKPSFAYSRD